MKIDKKRKICPAQIRDYMGQGLTETEAVSLELINPRDTPRHHNIISSLILHRETLRLVDPTGLDELARTSDRADQWNVVNHYVFPTVIQGVSQSDARALAKYALWVFHEREFDAHVDVQVSDGSFGSLGNVFGNLDVGNFPP